MDGDLLLSAFFFFPSFVILVVFLVLKKEMDLEKIHETCAILHTFLVYLLA